jgi:hypothetical protein
MLEQNPPGRKKIRNTPQLAAGIGIFKVLQVYWRLVPLFFN